MAARTKPLQVVTPVESSSLTEVVKFELPAAKKGCHYLTADQMDELVRLLHEEAKVI